MRQIGEILKRMILNFQIMVKTMMKKPKFLKITLYQSTKDSSLSESIPGDFEWLSQMQPNLTITNGVDISSFTIQETYVKQKVLNFLQITRML